MDELIKPLLLFAAVIASGSGIFRLVIAPGWQSRVLTPACMLCAVAALGMASVTDGRNAAAALVTALLAASGAVAAVLVKGSGSELGPLARGAVATIYVALGASLAMAGHAADRDEAWIAVPLAMVHSVAAAVWVGGLVELRRSDVAAADAASIVRRFSGFAFASVVVLVVTGAYESWVQLGGFQLSLLVDDAYGRLLLGKLLLLAGIVPLAQLNRSTLVPSLDARGDEAVTVLRRYVRHELVLVAAIMVLTALLVSTAPPADG